MNRKTMLTLSPVAAAVMLALGSAAHAAAPAANALPGAFLTNQTSNVSYTITGSNAGAISIPGGNTVLQFGGATSATVSTSVPVTLSPTTLAGVTTVAGFNIGASATLGINATATGANVLVSDLTGQASNIYGTLNANGSVASLFVANPNGVVVGGAASVSAANVGLFGYQADEANFTAAGSVTVGVAGAAGASIGSPAVTGTPTATANGAVTVNTGATVNAGYLLVAGAGQVNVGSVAGTVTTLDIAAGASATAAGQIGTTAPAVVLGTTVVSNSAVANLGDAAGSINVAGIAAVGAVNVLGTAGINNATVGGTLTNSGDLTLDGTNNVSAVVNNVTLAASDAAGTYGTITNNAYANIGGTDTVSTLTNNANATVANTVTVGTLTNSANLDLSGTLNLGGTFANAGKATLASAINATKTGAAVNNTGTLDASASGLTTLTTVTLGSLTNTGAIYEGGHGVAVTAGTISLGGTVANNSTSAAIGGVTLAAQTGDVTGTATLKAGGSVSLTSAKGNVNYTGPVTVTGTNAVTATATTGAVTLGAVSVTGGALLATAGNGDLTLGGNVTDANAVLKATAGSVYVNGNLTDTGDVGVTAANQIMVNGNVAATSGTVNLDTTKLWTGAYNLGVVIQPSGGVTAQTVNVTAAGNQGNMLQYGTLAAKTGFNFTGNSYYQGAGAAINTSSATFNFGNSSTASAAIAGGIVAGSTNPQPSGAFFNAVVVGGSNTTGAVTLGVNAAKLGSVAQNVNLMGIGNTTVTSATNSAALFGPSGSAVINTSFVPSNLFVRAQGGNLTLNSNATGGGFYWPGLIYASTVQSGMVATVDTTKTITVGSGTDAFSNALPYQAAGGAGIYLMTGKINVGDITTNTNSNINVLNALQVAGVNLYTAAAPVGLVLNYSATLPATNVVAYTPPAN